MQHYDPTQNFEILMSDNQAHDSRQTSSPFYDSPENSDAQSSGDEFKKGLWTPEEDEILLACVQKFKEGNWSTIAHKSGLLRSGKSCRLRWVKHLSPEVKNGPLTEEEQKKIVYLQSIHGNKWSLMSSLLPGRSDNTIKNFWNSYRKRSVRRHQVMQELQRSKSTSDSQNGGRGQTHIGKVDQKKRVSETDIFAISMDNGSGNFDTLDTKFDKIPCFTPARDKASDASGVFETFPSNVSTFGSRHTRHTNSMDFEDTSPTEKLQNSPSLESKVEETVEKKRVRHLAEARHVWDRILASPTGMCAALRDTMPAILLATAGFLHVDQATGQTLPSFTQAPSDAMENAQQGPVHPLPRGHVSGSHACDEFENRPLEGQRENHPPPQVPLSLSKAEESFSDGLLAPVNFEQRGRPCTSGKKMELTVQKPEFSYPEIFRTPEGLFGGRSLISPSLAALITSPRMDSSWDGAKYSTSPNFHTQ